VTGSIAVAGDAASDGDRVDRNTWLALTAMALGAVVLAFIRRTEPAEGHPRALRWRHRAHA
jgi:hypothetical protein